MATTNGSTRRRYRGMYHSQSKYFKMALASRITKTDAGSDKVKLSENESIGEKIDKHLCAYYKYLKNDTYYADNDKGLFLTFSKLSII